MEVSYPAMRVEKRIIKVVLVNFYYMQFLSCLVG